MDSSDRRSRSLSPNRAIASLTTVALALASCGADISNHLTQDVDCAAEAMPGSFLRQSGGNLSPDDLAARVSADDHEARPPDVLGGYFSYWTETVEQAPFDPPANIVCQSLIFANETDAQAYVLALRPDPADLARATMAWPDRELEVEETRLARRSDVRVFVASPHGGGSFGVTTVIRADGDRVLAVQGGGPSGALTPEDLLPLLDSFATGQPGGHPTSGSQ